MRDLKKGDRVKITGPWDFGKASNDFEDKVIGEFAVVTEVKKLGHMPITLNIIGHGQGWHWCRENLRALPRRL